MDTEDLYVNKYLESMVPPSKQDVLVKPGLVWEWVAKYRVQVAGDRRGIRPLEVNPYNILGREVWELWLLIVKDCNFQVKSLIFKNWHS